MVSCKLVFTPKPQKKGGGWGVPLRDIVNDKFGLPCVLDSSDLPFLQGVMAAGSDQLKQQTAELIEAIEKHDAIECNLEC